MADNLTYCLCGLPYDVNQFMIECDVCKDWFHGSCVGVLELISSDIDKFHCPRCEPLCGSSIFKIRTNLHRHNPYDPDAGSKPVQTGTKMFIDELMKRTFSSGDEVVRTMRGQQLSLPYLIQNGFNEPVLVEHKEGLGMIVPPDHFSLCDVERYIGSDKEIDVINVTSQTDHKMKLHDFVEYYQNGVRNKVLNCISLEFSKTTLSEVVEAPYIARKLDWANTVWPRNLPPEYVKPDVQKYCLMGVENSYTDFHIDFGGTSVWYHVLRGEKVFYLIQPTPSNLLLYQRWMTSSTQSETFFADQVDRCYKCVVRQGFTLLIPTGWIHAVLTPKDSLVFGGNFLHSLNIPMQLQVYEIEKKTKTPEKFCYPMFETINWFAADKLLQDLREYNSKCNKCPLLLLQGVKALLATLKLWSQDRDANKTRREDIPVTITSQKILKDLGKEVRHAERYLNSLNPPKPERESKRKKKKPIDKDFVDLSQPLSLQNLQEEKAPVKLNIKNINKKIEQCSLKLTLPKPIVYPYTMQPVGTVPEDCVDIKAEHVNGRDTVLRFKLGKAAVAKDSVYDFHDSDEDHLLIDERPKKLRHVVPDRKVQSVPGVFLLNGKGVTSAPGGEAFADMDVAGEVDVESELPKNGIDELLKASTYQHQAQGERSKIRKRTHLSHITSAAADSNDGSSPASPCTSEAIAGMLSISHNYMAEEPHTKTVKQRQKRGRPPLEQGDVQLEEEQMAKVHQDEDYVYPTLDASDDEDFIFKPRGRRKMDEAWNPKARVGPVVPKTDRPVREGTKKQSVEKGLEAAAAKRAGLPAPKRPYHRKKPRVVEDAPATSSTATPASSTASNTCALPAKKSEHKNRKPKKGMATAKQRLGKILKLHKMVF